ncbi:hypothetical protein QEV83_15090 [Methylocapsa sp. D3K7]|uniref:hypothetical protein n=1 Tax=Methylocapsa sp. D3K7 TaxID=3041435 RepID=UPI00244EFC85|nr:hypothetical protein [Methylocapsa sp. D3K7]WGJ13977.1 hypothetical protein QEV83_15090 [Methylocapsa sp. D3K7]
MRTIVRDDDNSYLRAYNSYMNGGHPYIVLKLQTKNPIQIGDFVSEFISITSQYDKFIKESYPALAQEAQIFVKSVRHGSVIAVLLPFVPFMLSGEILAHIEHINAINEFVRNFGEKIEAYVSGRKVDNATRSDLKDFMGAVAAIANDPKGKASIASAVFEGGKIKTRVAVTFDSTEARRAVTQIEEHQRQLEQRNNADYSRVLGIFKQANTRDSPIGRRTSERLKIEQLSDRDLPLVYASDLAEQRIKHEIREADDNLFKKGFIVDINVETIGGRPVAYRVTNLHQVIDLPSEIDGT